jgi:EmrB/QacA subfamily drug resistance transporter
MVLPLLWAEAFYRLQHQLGFKFIAQSATRSVFEQSQDPNSDVRRRNMSQSHLGVQKALVEGRQHDLAAIPQESARPVRLKPGEPAQTEVRRWRAFALLVVAYFMTIVDLTIVNVSLPTIGAKLHFRESDLQWVVTAYGLTFGGFLLLGGRAADLLGRRRLLMAGLVIFTAASLACGLSTSDTFLIVMRGFQGFGAAVVLPAALSIVMNIFPEGAERNKALGIWGACGAMGATVGLLAGGLLTRYIGWQYIFFFNVPVGTAAFALAPKIVPESRLHAERRRYDPLGAVTITSALVVLVYAISRAPQVGWAATQTIGMLSAAAALLVAFFIVETRVEAPLLPLRLFRLSTVAGSNAVSFLLTGSFYTFIFVGTLYMQQVLHYSALKTGVAWLAASLTSVACAGLSQMLVTKTSAKIVMVFGMALIGGGILWATQIPTDGTFWHDLAGPFLVSGMGTAFAFIPVSIGGLAGITERDAGVASGLLNTSQQLGGAIGVAVASSVTASHFHTLIHQGYGTASALTGGFQLALWVCGLTGLVGIPVALVLIRRAEMSKAVASTQQPKVARSPQPTVAVAAAAD